MNMIIIMVFWTSSNKTYNSINTVKLNVKWHQLVAMCLRITDINI